MQIRTLFPVCMFALATLSASLGGWLMVQAVLDYAQAGRLERAVEMDALWFVAGDKIGVERPVTAELLLGDQPADNSSLASLSAIRQDADRSLTTLEARIRTLTYPGARQQLEIIQAVSADLANMRNFASANLARPKIQRDPSFFQRFLAGLNAVADQLDDALDLGDGAASQHDGATMDLIELAREDWSLRSLVGRRGTQLIAVLESGGWLDGHQAEGQANFAGKIANQWYRIDALIRRLPEYPGLMQAVAAAHDGFDENERLSHTVVAAGLEGNQPPMSAMDLSHNLAHTNRLITKIRDAALAAARARAIDNRRTAALSAAISAFGVLLIMTGKIATIWLLKRRIFTPVLFLTKEIARLAQRDYAIEVPAQARMDEIGRMALALETLRQNAIAAAKAEAEIVRMLRDDPLTGLANRNLFHERMAMAIAGAASAGPCAVLCVDLDRFKAVNDTYGHAVGDLLLQTVAHRLLGCVREIDTVSRIGADEFAVLLVGLENVDHASIVADRIAHALNIQFDLDGRAVSVGASIGIAVAPQDATSATALLQSAGIALYRAKEEEPGSYRYFKEEMNERLQARVALEADLREAVRNQAFELAYQPQYALAADRLCGFEALLRWHHPTRGIVSPAEFIPLAEDTGLIVPIGAWVLQKACEEAVNWSEEMTLAVNLSAIQFKKPGIAETVRQALEASGLPSRRLDLEITETTLLNNSSNTLAALRELRGLGVSISMDDFGNGYSSLSYLRSFPFDTIKIDQSFVRDLAIRDDARAIIRAVVALGKSLGMKTLAEGVETTEQLALLRLAGCDEVQGFLFGKPLAVDQARKLATQVAAEAVPTL